jgi:lysozyme
MNMELSDKGKELIKKFEGLYLKAYRCPAGVLTIGWGCTEGVYEGQVITTAQAEHMLDTELSKFVSSVNKLVSVPLSQNQFDVLVSFSYNVGVGALSNSTLLKRLNSGGYASVPSQLMRWTHGGGVELPGLITRRKVEAALWSSSVDIEHIKHNTEPMAQRVDSPETGRQFMNPLSIIGTIISVLVPTIGNSTGPVSGAGTTVSPVTSITNAIGMIVGAILAKQGFDSGTATTIGGGVAVLLASLLNQLHITGGSNVNTAINSSVVAQAASDLNNASSSVSKP